MNNLGQTAEANALTWLRANNLSLVKKNYHCRFGEIDLIMLDKDILVFIEVRLRSSNHFGNAASSVTLQKQKKIITTANHFLMTEPQYSQYICRFDVIAYESNAAQIEPMWYKDAFRL